MQICDLQAKATTARMATETTQARPLNQATTTEVASQTFRLRDCDITVAMVTVDDKEVKVQGHAASRCKADDRRSVNKQRQHHLV